MQHVTVADHHMNIYINATRIKEQQINVECLCQIQQHGVLKI